MLRHKRNAHPTQSSDEEDPRMSDIFSSDNDSSDIDTDSSVDISQNPWEDIIDEAVKRCQPDFDAEVNKLVSNGMDEDAAGRSAFDAMRGQYRKAMMNDLGKRILWFQSMKRDVTYRKLKATVDRLVSKEGYLDDEALKYGILKRQFLFDKFVDRLETRVLPEEEDMSD